MYVVIDKSSKKIIHINRAPLSQKLTEGDVYHKFDSDTMQIATTDATVLPDHYKISDKGEIVDLDTEEKVRRGLLKIHSHQKVHNGVVENKTMKELVEDGLLTIDNRQKIVNNEIIEKSMASSMTKCNTSNQINS